MVFGRLAGTSLCGTRGAMRRGVFVWARVEGLVLKSLSSRINRS